MKNGNRIGKTEKHEGLRKLEAAQLADVTGGTMWVGDGYCGTPVPWPPRPWQVTGASLYVNPAPWTAGLTGIQQYGVG
jgi:hypothetical protein